MTDVSTYIEAEEYAEYLYDQYYNYEVSPQLGPYNIIYIETPRLFNGIKIRIENIDTTESSVVPL